MTGNAALTNERHVWNANQLKNETTFEDFGRRFFAFHFRPAPFGRCLEAKLRLLDDFPRLQRKECFIA